MTRTAVLRPLASALALAGLFVACAGGGGNPGIGIASGFEPIRFAAGNRKPAPSFSGTTLRGDRPISNAILSGKVGVVNFWGSWCGPCRREQGPLEMLSKEYGARVQFVGINARRDQKAAALAYLDEFGVTYPSVFNPDSSIAYAFRVRFMPATFVIDKQGKIAAEFIGAIADVNALRIVIGSEPS
jgi:thiol-disulfide isomerase/thioredoxin